MVWLTLIQADAGLGTPALLFFFFKKNSNQLSLLSGGALCGAHASRSGVAVAPRASPEARPQRWSSGPGVGGDGSRRWRGICRLPQSEPPPLRPRLSRPRLFSAPTASAERAPPPPPSVNGDTVILMMIYCPMISRSSWDQLSGGAALWGWAS